MKANQKIVSRLLDEDNAVSPVIAVILMVAITVVLAATVYVWVSGFSSTQESSEQASASAKGASGSIRVILTQAGQSASSNAYSAGNFNIYINGNAVDFSKSTCTDGDFVADTDPGSWAAGEPVVIKSCLTNAATSLSAADYAVTVEVAGTAIYDGMVTVT